MKTIIQNPFQLTDSDITHTANRVKAIIVNDSGSILVCKSKGCFSFIGGHIEDGEALEDCLKREICEETGIELKQEEIYPFIEFIKYDKDYFSTGVCAKSTITYFIVKTNKKVDKNKQKLDEQEKQDNFEAQYLDLKTIETTLLNDAGYEKKSELYHEMLFVISQYKENQELVEKNNTQMGG